VNLQFCRKLSKFIFILEIWTKFYQKTTDINLHICITSLNLTKSRFVHNLQPKLIHKIDPRKNRIRSFLPDGPGLVHIYNLQFRCRTLFKAQPYPRTSLVENQLLLCYFLPSAVFKRLGLCLPMFIHMWYR
jgi:hypothetical protein